MDEEWLERRAGLYSNNEVRSTSGHRGNRIRSKEPGCEVPVALVSRQRSHLVPRDPSYPVFTADWWDLWSLFVLLFFICFSISPCSARGNCLSKEWSVLTRILHGAAESSGDLLTGLPAATLYPGQLRKNLNYKLDQGSSSSIIKSSFTQLHKINLSEFSWHTF